jgi:NAD(P)-dependent dehydrogenase (short-subunit alcohol dehydrogenase family)
MNMEKMFDFSNANALIMGGGSGIGKEIAKALCKNGASVIISGRSIKKLNATKKEIDILHQGACNVYVSDISIKSSVEELISYTSELFSGRLNILVNSAGVNVRGPIEEVTLEDFEEVMSINLTGTFLATKLAYSLLKSAEYGRVINLASIFSTVSFPHRLSYSSSKAGVLLFSKTVALEWAEQGITVNTISPGPLLTEINKKVLEDKENYEKFCERIPMRRFGEPYEIVTAALFLASPYSSYVTGSDIVVDGGWTST